MNFRIAGTFTDSLAKLTAEEQKIVKTTAFDLQVNPANPGMQFHRVDRVKDKNFWSVRVNRDIRVIVHKTDDSLMLCYVDHHDDAYHWAERRKLETHPTTGAAQIVEVRETVKEFIVPVYVEKKQERSGTEQKQIFKDLSREDLLSYGVPSEWTEDVLKADEESILDLAEHLPEEASEVLLEIATGGKAPIRETDTTRTKDPFDHPDAQRRFRTLHNVEELEQALDYPWEKWTIFLHPTQRATVERTYSGPARVSGSAGTGKTIVALHRAVFLARKDENACVLLTTFSDELAQALRIKLRRLVSSQPMLGERIDVESMGSFGLRLYERNIGKVNLVNREEIAKLLAIVMPLDDSNKFTHSFLMTEWEHVVDAWQLESWEDYRDVKRLGRKTRLTEEKRKQLWTVFEQIKKKLSSTNQLTQSGLFSKLAQRLAGNKNMPYDYIIVDEAQDISIAQLKLLATIAGNNDESLFFAGDIGQRIFQQPFSWKSLGVDIRGRSKTLRINYRTSHQIRMQADKLLDPELSDYDGNVETRKGTISVFNGFSPTIKAFDDVESEIDSVAAWLIKKAEEGILPNEIGVFVRSSDEIQRGQKAVEKAGLKSNTLIERLETKVNTVTLSTMHLAKGLEFKAVVVMACDDHILPSQERIEASGDTAELEEIYNTERQLLYVACTRARDQLFVSGVSPISEFLEDLESR